MTLPPFVRVMKGNPGAFTCLGNWYDLDNPESMASLHSLLLGVTSNRDKVTAAQEIEEAKELQASTGFAYKGNL